MATVRSFIAVFLLLNIPTAVALWYVIHPFARAWRRIGLVRTYSVLMIPAIALAWLLWQMRVTLVGADWGTQPLLWVLAVVAFVAGSLIHRARRRHLTHQILVGGPELSSSDKGRLLTEGIYASVRNPRYLESIFFVLGCACVANYSGTWILVFLTVPAFHMVVLLEESELRDRFGGEYDEYCRRVPRWIPRR